MMGENSQWLRLNQLSLRWRWRHERTLQSSYILYILHTSPAHPNEKVTKSGIFALFGKSPYSFRLACFDFLVLCQFFGVIILVKQFAFRTSFDSGLDSRVDLIVLRCQRVWIISSSFCFTDFFFLEKHFNFWWDEFVSVQWLICLVY